MKPGSKYDLLIPQPRTPPPPPAIWKTEKQTDLLK